MAVGHAGRHDGGRLRLAQAHVQVPVAAQLGRAGERARSGDVAAGVVGDLAHQRLAGCALGHFAAVDQQVAMSAQGGADGGQRITLFFDGRHVQPLTGQLDGAGAAMRDQVDAVHLRTSGQMAGHLGQPRLAGLDVGDFGARRHRLDQQLGLLHVPVQECNDLAHFNLSSALRPLIRNSKRTNTGRCARAHRPRTPALNGRRCG